MVVVVVVVLDPFFSAKKPIPSNNQGDEAARVLNSPLTAASVLPAGGAMTDGSPAAADNDPA